MHSADFLIIGQGLAGTTLAWQLVERGRSFLIVDRDEAVTSSKIAAGLITPITGMRLTVNWRFDALHPEAVMFYEERERLLERQFYFPMPLVRLFRDEKERGMWSRRREDAAVRELIDPAAPEPLVDAGMFDQALGGFQQRLAGYVDTAAYLEASRVHFEKLGCWMKGEVNEEDVALHTGEPQAHASGYTDGVTWGGRKFEAAIFCRGWEGARSRWFSWVPFEPALGTVLTLRSDLQETRLINRRCWLLPRGDGVFRAGSTYEWTFDDPHTPSEDAVRGLEEKLRGLIKPDFVIEDQQTAVRPIIKDRPALMGRHPTHRQLIFFNGLGSKGVLRAPFMARRLVEHLLDDAVLEKEFDLQSNH